MLRRFVVFCVLFAFVVLHFRLFAKASAGVLPSVSHSIAFRFELMSCDSDTLAHDVEHVW